MVTFPNFYEMRNFRQIPLTVNTLAKFEAVDCNKILAYLQLLDLLFQSIHLFLDDKLNLN